MKGQYSPMQTQTKFTPGPWKAYGENVCAKLASDTRSEVVATTCGFQGTKKDIANAQLIALAPEMFAALESIVTQADGDLSDNEFRYYVKNTLARPVLSKLNS
jgi:hypothetical protein